MKKIYFSTLLLFVIRLAASAQVSHLFISQTFSSKSGANYNCGFVELFNPTGSSISLSGYSIQYASATRNTLNSMNCAQRTIAS